ncbi:MAG: hypothetical protein ACUVRD_06780 [Bacteroidia bacterium]
MIRWVFLGLLVWAQDSLYKELKKAKKNQVYEVLYALSLAWQEKNPDSALSWANRLLTLAQKKKNLYWQGRAHLLLAELHTDSLVSYQALLAVHRLLPQVPALYPALSYQWGNFYYRQGAWQEAMQHYFTAWQEMPAPDSVLLVRLVEVCLYAEELGMAKKALARAPNAPYVVALRALVYAEEKNCHDIPSPHHASSVARNLLAAWWYAWARCALEKQDTLSAMHALDTTLSYDPAPYYAIPALFWAAQARHEYFYKWLPLTEHYTDTLARWQVWVLAGDKAAQEKNFARASQMYYTALSVCTANVNALLRRIDMLAPHIPEMWLERFYQKLRSCYADTVDLAFHYLSWLIEAQAFPQALPVSTALLTMPLADSVRIPLLLQQAYLQAKNAQYGTAMSLLDSLLPLTLPIYEKAGAALLAAQVSFERGDPAGSMFYLRYAHQLLFDTDPTYAEKIQVILDAWQKNYVYASKKLAQMTERYKRFRPAPPPEPMPTIYTGNLKGRQGILWLRK